jgi:hypothetical protein
MLMCLQVAVNPIMVSAGEKYDFVFVGELENNPVFAVNAKTPKLFFFGFQFFGFQRRMKRVGTKNPLPPFRLFLNKERKFQIPPLKFRRVAYARHCLRLRSARSDESGFVFPPVVSRSARSKLFKNSLRNKPRFAASRSMRAASSRTVKVCRRVCGCMVIGNIV